MGTWNTKKIKLLNNALNRILSLSSLSIFPNPTKVDVKPLVE
jgi:hypothetical protein